MSDARVPTPPAFDAVRKQVLPIAPRLPESLELGGLGDIIFSGYL